MSPGPVPRDRVETFGERGVGTWCRVVWAEGAARIEAFDGWLVTSETVLDGPRVRALVSAAVAVLTAPEPAPGEYVVIVTGVAEGTDLEDARDALEAGEWTALTEDVVA